MKSIQPTDTEAPVAISDEAVHKLASLLSAANLPDKAAVRVSVRPGGCSGFSYEMYFDTSISPTDVLWAAHTDAVSVRVVVDSVSAPLLEGASLGYEDSVSRSGFTFSNPNASRTCGCGQSFS